MPGITSSWRITVGPRVVGREDRLVGVGAIVKADVRIDGQRAAHGFADEGLIVDEQDHDAGVVHRDLAQIGFDELIGALFHLSQVHDPRRV